MSEAKGSFRLGGNPISRRRSHHFFDCVPASGAGVITTRRKFVRDETKTPKNVYLDYADGNLGEERKSSGRVGNISRHGSGRKDRRNAVGKFFIFGRGDPLSPTTVQQWRDPRHVARKDRRWELLDWTRGPRRRHDIILNGGGGGGGGGGRIRKRLNFRNGFGRHEDVEKRFLYSLFWRTTFKANQSY